MALLSDKDKHRSIALVVDVAETVARPYHNPFDRAVIYLEAAKALQEMARELEEGKGEHDEDPV